MKTNALILLLLSVAFLFGSCKVGTNSTLVNNNIDEAKRKEIAIQNDKLFIALKNNDINGLKALFAPALLEKGGDVSELLNKMSSTMIDERYRVLDQYSVQNSTTGIANTLISGISGKNDYTLNYLALNKEMFASLLISDNAGNEILTTAIYGKYGNEWKINIIHFGAYSLGHKTAADLYDLAKEHYEQGFLVDAANYITLAKEYSTPAASYFTYRKQGEMEKFYTQIIAEANAKYHLPMTLENIPTKPQVFKIYPEQMEAVYAPAVLYLTKIKTTNLAALHAEYQQVKKEVKLRFNGIYNGKKMILYRAFNEFPNGTKKVASYGYIDTLKIN